MSWRLAISIIFAVPAIACSEGFFSDAPRSPGQREVSGWDVRCVPDFSRDETTCAMSRVTTDASRTLFRIWYLVHRKSGDLVAEGPNISFGADDARDTRPSIRIDGEDPIDDMRSPELIRKLRGGQTMAASIGSSSGGRIAVVMPLEGFDVAFAALKRQVAAARDATSNGQTRFLPPPS
jgi:invasion protein IalB